jgi:hypothetical protein
MHHLQCYHAERKIRCLSRKANGLVTLVSNIHVFQTHQAVMSASLNRSQMKNQIRKESFSYVTLRKQKSLKKNTNDVINNSNANNSNALPISYKQRHLAKKSYN